MRSLTTKQTSGDVRITYTVIATWSDTTSLSSAATIDCETYEWAELQYDHILKNHPDASILILEHHTTTRIIRHGEQ